MASTHHAAMPETSGHQYVVNTELKPKLVCEWDNVTDAFKTGPQSMAVGEMIHSKSFSLSSAMSAMELTDPRMNIGSGVVQNVREIPLPDTLSDSQLLNIMDQLFACEMSWLNAHTLPQTVFSCVYAQRLPEIPRPELFSFVRIQMATMDLILKLVMEERVADEEDFISWTFGFRLRPLRYGSSAEDNRILEDMLNDLKEFNGDGAEQGPILKESIYIRIKFCIQFYRTLSCLRKTTLSGATEGELAYLYELGEILSAWESCSSKQPVDQDLINRLFVASVNRHLVTSTPPRTAPLLTVKSAFSYMRKMITELIAMVNLRQMSLPGILRSNFGGAEDPKRYSLHVAIHAVESFCAEHKPTILTRTILSRQMIPKDMAALFGTDGAGYLRLVSTDMGFKESISNFGQVEPYKRLKDGIVSIFKCLCRNRSRQRRQILHVLRWWDQYSSFVTRSPNCNQANGVNCASPNSQGLAERDHVQGSTQGTEISSGQGSSTPKEKVDYLENKSPLQIVSYEISARLLVQHLLLGFEIDLYQEYEYPAVFFYVGYTLTAMAHATASFTKTGRKQAAFHPLRLALYIMDEARLWLCRALYSALQALSAGDLWDYSCNRERKSTKMGQRMFGSDALWYEQRFGIVRGLRNGPAYADYSSYLAFQTMQDESLHSDRDKADSISLRLEEAANGFLAARRNAEKAKRAAEHCESNFVMKEVLQIARVAIKNSLVVSALLRSYEGQERREPQNKYKVRFNFNCHQHFPVLEIIAGE